MKLLKTAIVASLMASMLAGTALAQDKTLNMIVIEGGDTVAMQAVADAYAAANPGVTINLQPYPFAQFFQVAELRLRSADAEGFAQLVTQALIWGAGRLSAQS